MKYFFMDALSVYIIDNMYALRNINITASCVKDLKPIYFKKLKIQYLGNLAIAILCISFIVTFVHLIQYLVPTTRVLILYIYFLFVNTIDLIIWH